MVYITKYDENWIRFREIVKMIRVSSLALAVDDAEGNFFEGAKNCKMRTITLWTLFSITSNRIRIRVKLDFLLSLIPS